MRRGRCPHRPGRQIRFHVIPRRIRYFPMGRCGHRSLRNKSQIFKKPGCQTQPGFPCIKFRHRREIFVQGKAGAGVHTIRQVRPTRPCAERSGGIFLGFICPAGRRCRAARDPQGTQAMRRRRWICG